MNRDVLDHGDSAPLETEFLSATVHTEDHADAELCIAEGSLNHLCHPSTEYTVSPGHVINDSDCNLPTQKVKKLKLLHGGYCHYNEVRCLCAISVDVHRVRKKKEPIVF